MQETNNDNDDEDSTIELYDASRIQICVGRGGYRWWRCQHDWISFASVNALNFSVGQELLVDETDYFRELTNILTRRLRSGCTIQTEYNVSSCSTSTI
jgi:hypothetical protein